MHEGPSLNSVVIAIVVIVPHRHGPASTRAGALISPSVAQLLCLIHPRGGLTAGPEEKTRVYWDFAHAQTRLYGEVLRSASWSMSVSMVLLTIW